MDNTISLTEYRSLKQKPEVETEKNATDWIERAIELFEIGDFKGAVHANREALFLEEKNTTALYNLALCFELLGELRGARDTYEAVLSIDKFFADAYLKLANIYVLLAKKHHKVYSELKK